MKKIIKLSGIIVLAAIIGFFLVSCGDSSGGNPEEGDLFATKPIASPAGGDYTATQTVTLTTTTGGAEIYYTLNGTTPTTASTKYISTITINTTTTLKAIAVKTGMTNSSIMTETYIINLFGVNFNPNGGNWSGDTNNKFVQVDLNTTVDEPISPTRNRASFAGWFTMPKGGTKFNFSTLITGNITLYAHWTYTGGTPIVDVNDIEIYLESKIGGFTAADPVNLPMQVNLGTMTVVGSGWLSILDAIATADKFINLDLSACTMTGTEFNPYAATGMDKIVDIALPDTATSIESYPFSNNSVLKSFSGAGLISIGDYAFHFCTNLALTSLPAGLSSIGSGAFSLCPNLALTSLPAGLTTIGDFTFSNCTNLALTSLPAGLTTIGNLAFYECTNLALTSLPAGLSSIGDSAFSLCPNLALTSLPAGLSSIGSGAFSNCTNLALTSLPAGLSSIGDVAFIACTNLALTSLPAGLIFIGERAFSNCTSLTQIILPAGINSIGRWGFRGCSSLALVTCLAENPPMLGVNGFGESHPSLQIKVPAGSVEAYKAAPGWSDYASIISAIP